MNKYSDIMLSLESILRMLQPNNGSLISLDSAFFMEPSKEATAEEVKKAYKDRLACIAKKLGELIEHCRGYVDPDTAQTDPVAKALQGVERVCNRMLMHQLYAEHSDLKSVSHVLNMPLKTLIYDDIKRLDDLTYSYESPDSHALSK